MADASPTRSDHILYTLAPSSITTYRTLRYDGSAMGADLDAFPQVERALLAEMYRVLAETFTLLRDEQRPRDVLITQLGRLYDASWHELLGRVRQLGSTLAQQAGSPRLRQIIHDLKGGAFQALAMHLQLLKLGLVGRDELHRMFFLARDQLKIMRNALPEIDPAGSARDEQQRLHAINLIVEKWQQTHYRLSAHGATISVNCQYSGAVAERCLEFSALDRVLYNLINNATAHTADGHVALAILPIPSDTPHHLRMIVSNRVAPEQQAALAARFPDGLGQLFNGGFTTGGSGLGLRICADFVCNAYGLASIQQGLAEGHFGATMQGERFFAWVHWPIAAD